MADIISLTVRSVNDATIDSTTQAVVVKNIYSLQANQNAYTTPSVTEAGDTGGQLASWSLSGTGELLYWKLTNPSGTDHYVTLYKGSQGGYAVAQGYVTGNGVIYGSPLNESGIYFAVTLTYSGEDTDNANTVQLTTFIDQKDLELPGNTQITYLSGNEITKITVDETLSAIVIMVNGASTWFEARKTLTTAQLGALNGTPIQVIATPGAGYILVAMQPIVEYTYGVAALTVNTTMDLVSGTTGTRLWTAASAVAGAASINTRFTEVAGVMQSNQGIKAKMNTGEATVGSGSTSTATVIIPYTVITI
jgi:hypothetical protein